MIFGIEVFHLSCCFSLNEENESKKFGQYEHS